MGSTISITASPPTRKALYCCLIASASSDSTDGEDVTVTNNNNIENTDIAPNTTMSLDKLFHHMRFYQNIETSEVIFVLGSDKLENVPQISIDEWFEVPVSCFQEAYIRQSMKPKTLQEHRQFFQEEDEDAIVSISSSPHKLAKTPAPPASPRIHDGQQQQQQKQEEKDVTTATRRRRQRTLMSQSSQTKKKNSENHRRDELVIDMLAKPLG